MNEITAGPKLMYPIDRLKPHPQNARQHSEDQVTQLANSIQEFGFTQPILVDENDVILAGHGKRLVLLCYKRTFSCRIVLWVQSVLRQAHKRNALRHLWRAWRKPQGTLIERYR